MQDEPFINKEGYDPLMRPPPGHSLTLPPGNQPYESPPKFSKSKDFIEYIDNSLRVPDVEESLMESLIMGTSIQEVVETFGIAAFTEGLANPDVVENSKPEIFINILSQAMDFFDVRGDSPLPFKMFATETGDMRDEGTGTSEIDTLMIAQENNPQGFKMVEQGMNAQNEKAYEEQVTQMAQDLDQYRTSEIREGSFLNVNAQPEEDV